MVVSWIFAVLVGIAIVVQAGLNREISQSSGLASTLLVNCLFTFIFSLVLWGVAIWKPTLFPEFVRVQGRGLWISPSHVMAALGGFCIIFGMPLAMSRIGALKTIALVMAIQLFVGVLWDVLKEGLPITLQRVVGAIVTLVGALLTLMA